MHHADACKAVLVVIMAFLAVTGVYSARPSCILLLSLKSVSGRRISPLEGRTATVYHADTCRDVLMMITAISAGASFTSTRSLCSLFHSLKRVSGRRISPPKGGIAAMYHADTCRAVLMIITAISAVASLASTRSLCSPFQSLKPVSGRRISPLEGRTATMYHADIYKAVLLIIMAILEVVSISIARSLCNPLLSLKHIF